MSENDGASPLGGERTTSELRIAVVFNGGVSLAVWMGGVTHELNLLRLASEQIGHHPNSSVIEAWKSILDETKRSVVIDLVAGTSAGGLNGSLLANAVARGVDLPDMKTKWRTLASLDTGRLTRDYANPRNDDRPETASILSGGYFTASIDGIFGEMAENARPSSDRLKPRDCTLLVSATALKSPPTVTLLENGQAMRTSDGRRIYLFERRSRPVDSTHQEHDRDPATGRKPPNDQKPVDDFNDFPGALGLAARASASFPVAFEPVFETGELARQRAIPANTSSPTWLADGGILDNAPFEPLLGALKRIPLDQPFSRLLLYVTPSVDMPTKETRRKLRPPLAKVLGAVVSAIREPDQRLDRDALDDTFRLMNGAQSQPYMVLRDYLRDPTAFSQKNQRLQDAATAIFPLYRANRIRAVQDFLTPSGSDVSPLVPPTDPSPGTEVDELGDVTGPLPRSPDDLMLASSTTWMWGISTARRVLRWWGRALNDDSHTDDPFNKSAMKTVVDNYQRVDNLYERMKSAVHDDDSLRTPTSKAVALSKFYVDGTPSVTTELHRYMHEAAEGVKHRFKNISTKRLIELSLEIEVISGTFDWSSSEYDTPIFRYVNLTPAAQSPIALGPVAEERDWPSTKLYGERWGHFGAFSGAEERDQDWLWGRIDGATQLSDHLFRLANVDGTALQKKLIDAILAEVTPLTADGARGEDFTLLAGAQARAKAARESNAADADVVEAEAEVADLGRRLAVKVRAETTWETTSTQLAARLLCRPEGRKTLKNLLQTVLVVTQPTGFLTRMTLACSAPLYPSRELRQWPRPQRWLGVTLWGLGYPIRSLAIWYGLHRLKKAAKKSTSSEPPRRRPKPPRGQEAHQAQSNPATSSKPPAVDAEPPKTPQNV